MFKEKTLIYKTRSINITVDSKTNSTCTDRKIQKTESERNSHSTVLEALETGQLAHVGQS